MSWLSYLLTSIIWIVVSGNQSNQSECQAYKELQSADRRLSFGIENEVRCDSSMGKRWYRFTGAAGSQMPLSCVPTKHCGTHAPGWVNGSHPNTSEGIVSRQVCFHWSGDCCRWSKQIRVRNCGEFFVYELGPTPACRLRYCGSPGVDSKLAYFTLSLPRVINVKFILQSHAEI